MLEMVLVCTVLSQARWNMRLSRKWPSNVWVWFSRISEFSTCWISRTSNSGQTSVPPTLFLRETQSPFVLDITTLSTLGSENWHKMKRTKSWKFSKKKNSEKYNIRSISMNWNDNMKIKKKIFQFNWYSPIWKISTYNLKLKSKL